MSGLGVALAETQPVILVGSERQEQHGKGRDDDEERAPEVITENARTDLLASLRVTNGTGRRDERKKPQATHCAEPEETRRAVISR